MSKRGLQVVNFICGMKAGGGDSLGWIRDLRWYINKVRQTNIKQSSQQSTHTHTYAKPELSFYLARVLVT